MTLSSAAFNGTGQEIEELTAIPGEHMGEIPDDHLQQDPGDGDGDGDVDEELDDLPAVAGPVRLLGGA